MYKEEIEESFGNKLDWQRLNEGKGSRIAYFLRDVNIFDEDDWPQMTEFTITNMIKLEKTIKLNTKRITNLTYTIII